MNRSEEKGNSALSKKQCHDERTRARPKPRCGAHTRAGNPCNAPVVPNSNRCRRHGGAAGVPLGNCNAMKHGIYSRYRTPNEAAMLSAVRSATGSVDNELEQARFELIRLQAARDAAETNSHDGLELQKRHDRESSEYGPGDEQVFERVDYSARIIAATRHVAQLEKDRATLLAAAIERGDIGGDTDGGLTTTDTFIAPDEPIPDNPIL